MKRKKSPRKKLVAEADRVFSLAVRKRGGNRCWICGSHKNPQCGHILSRVAYSVRWDLRNAVVMCASCNLRMEHDVPHIRAVTDSYIQFYGLDAWEKLVLDWHTVRKYTNEELQQIIDHYRGLL